MPNQAPSPNNYERALLSAPPQAIAPNPHTNLLNVYIQLANKMGFQQQQQQLFLLYIILQDLYHLITQQAPRLQFRQ
jgi:hypothetical protein